MKTEIRRDMQHNYFIISDEMMSCGTFQNKMLEYNHLKGFLPYSLQSIDAQRKLYYEISGLQQLSTVIQRFPMSCMQTVRIMQQLVELITMSGEYLLKEQDILLDPEYMFIKLPSYELFVCYYPGYRQPLRKQLSKMLEFFMGNVDYEDKEAVLLSYSLYMKSKEETGTICELIELLNNQPQSINQPQNANQFQRSKPQNMQSQSSQLPVIQPVDMTPQKVLSQSVQPQNEQKDVNQSLEFSPRNRMSDTNQPQDSTGRLPLSSMPVGNTGGQSQPCEYKKQESKSMALSKMANTYGMGPRAEEKEVMFYPVQIYLIAGLVVLAAAIIMLFLLSSGLLRDSLTGKIPPIKLIVSLIIIILPCAYAMLKIFSSEHKQSRMISTMVYPQKNIPDMTAASKRSDPVKEDTIAFVQELPLHQTNQPGYQEESAVLQEAAAAIAVGLEQLPADKTTILNQPDQMLYAQLIPKPGSELEPIVLSEFPFYIGTVKNRMNYSLKSPVISRYHAKVDKEGNHYYVTDLNSTNGTFLNGTQMKPEEANLLVAKDKISFANIEFEFECPASNFFL